MIGALKRSRFVPRPRGANWLTMLEPGRRCAECQRPYEARAANQKFCSAACRDRERNRRRNGAST